VRHFTKARKLRLGHLSPERNLPSIGKTKIGGIQMNSVSTLITGFVMLVVQAGVFGKQDSAEISHQIADAYGVSSFSGVSKIRYTFNLARDTLHIARSWIWEPKMNRVTFQNDSGKENPVTYVRAKPGDSLPAPQRSIDRMFINDQYWFLFPFHLVWDSMVTIAVKQDQNLPIGNGTMMQVTVAYPKTGGYTPGDAFDLFIDKNYHIAQWRYWRGGEKMLMTSAWERNTSVGPLLFSLDRPGGTKNFNVWFTNVAVLFEKTGSWVEAK
jgi:hypothetical protein